MSTPVDPSLSAQSQSVPDAAPYVVMDQRGNYWRVFPKGTLAGADEDMWSMCPTSVDNYASEPVAIYRQGGGLLDGLRAARAVVERQTDLTELVHFERPSDFRKGILSCLVALDNAIQEAEK